MYICQVTGKVISTIKHPSIGAGSLIFVKPIDTEDEARRELMVAYDTIGCGEGNIVLVTSGANARFAHLTENAPIDLAVVGIVDHYEIGKKTTVLIRKKREHRVKRAENRVKSNSILKNRG